MSITRQAPSSALAHLALVCLLIFGLGGATLRAHTNPYPRWDHVTLQGGQIQIEMGWDLDPGQPSQEVRRRYDEDGDGFLSASERVPLHTWMGEAASRWLQIAADGKALTLRRDKVEVRPLDVPVNSNRPLGVVVTVSAPLPSPLTTLSLTDHHPARTFPVMLSLVDNSSQTLTTYRRAPGLLLSPPPPTAVSAGRWDPHTRQLTHVALTPGEVLWLEWSGGDASAKVQPR